MPRQLHSAPAAAAMTVILCVAGCSFVTLAMLASRSPIAYHFPAINSVGAQVHNLVRGVMAILLLGYLVGIVGWLMTFALRWDGMHRLASVLNGSHQRR